jgi:hypothetical protein
MAQVVSRRLPTAEARVRPRVCPCGIFDGQSGTGTGFSPSTSVFPCQFHSTGAPLLGKRQKVIIITIFITGLHKKPQGCGASVVSAAGPFTTKNTLSRRNYVNTWSNLNNYMHYQRTVRRIVKYLRSVRVIKMVLMVRRYRVRDHFPQPWQKICVYVENWSRKFICIRSYGTEKSDENSYLIHFCAFIRKVMDIASQKYSQIKREFR